MDVIEFHLTNDLYSPHSSFKVLFSKYSHLLSHNPFPKWVGSLPQEPVLTSMIVSYSVLKSIFLFSYSRFLAQGPVSIQYVLNKQMNECSILGTISIVDIYEVSSDVLRALHVLNKLIIVTNPDIVRYYDYPPFFSQRIRKGSNLLKATCQKW